MVLTMTKVLLKRDGTCVAAGCVKQSNGSQSGATNSQSSHNGGINTSPSELRKAVSPAMTASALARTDAEMCDSTLAQTSLKHLASMVGLPLTEWIEP